MQNLNETITVKVWVDDVRPAPEGYKWIKSVNEAIDFLRVGKWYDDYIVNVDFFIDIDHDAGDYASDGGDYIKILDWMEKENMRATFHIHSMNPVGVQNMRNIIQRNGWKEVRL